MKNRFFVTACWCLLLFFAVSHSAVNYPYPQRVYYGNGTINAEDAFASQSLKGKFLSFLDGFYEEGNCNGNRDCARIKFDDTDYTVSEGIGYGMIMMVYFSDATTSYQTHFDKLWAYYQKWVNGNGLMHWKIRGFQSITEQNGATDAEFDVALALAMAFYQFGDSKYQTAAQSLIAKIWQREMNSDGLHRPGDGWDDDKNPSYVSPAAFEIFKDLDNATNWNSAISRNYTFLNANQNSSTGLPSGWANSNGTPKSCTYCDNKNATNYDQDAVRAPWRWAWTNAWFGSVSAHSSAKTLLNKLGSWVSTKDPSTVKGAIGLTGTWGPDHNSGYVGSLMCALTGNSAYQSQLDSYWGTLSSLNGESYFNRAMQLLTGLLVTGNMPNLKACNSAPGKSCGTKMPTGGYDGTSTSIDKFYNAGNEDIETKGFAATWESWYAYTDAGSNGSSTITNNSFETLDENSDPICEPITSYRVVSQQGGSGDWSAEIPSYNLVQGNNQYDPYVALGLNARNNNNPQAGEAGYDLSQCEGGFSYQYKGQSHNFKVQTKEVDPTTGCDHAKPINVVATNWETVQVPLSGAGRPTKPGWESCKNYSADINLREITGFIWELKGGIPTDKTCKDGGVSACTGSLAIKDFRCLGELKLPSARPVPKCNSPIRLPQLTNGNALIAMQNAVNLRIQDKAIIQIFDLKGKTIRTLDFAQGNHTVQLSDLPRGLYIVKASNNSWNRIVKVTVK